MKLVIISELFFPAVGGQEVRYAELIPYLIRRGHAVTVLTIAHQGGLADEESFHGARIIRTYKSLDYLGKGTGKGRPLRGIVGFASSLLQHRRVIREADAVIFNKWPVLPQFLFGHLVRRGTVDWCEIRRGPVWDVIYQCMARSAPRHIGVSDAIVEYLRREQQVGVEDSCAVLSGVSSQLYQPVGARRERQILFFGRMSEHKDPGLLLRTFLAAFSPDGGFRLVMAGAGELLETLKVEAAGADNVVFTGRISDEEKIRLLGESALLVLPSKREGFPRVIAEAAAAGTPTLTVDHAMNGGAEVVRQYGLGWVCAPTEAALTAAILKNSDLTNPEWAAASERCRQAAREHFDWDAVTDRLVSFLNR